MPGPRTYLHVGAPKTGTTFTQGVLWANKGLLARRGVWLPGNEPNDHFRAGYDLRGYVQEPDDPRDGWAGLWDSTAAQIREATSEVAVISDERLASCTSEQAQRAVDSLAPTEVHVIYTVREFGQLMSAEWQEHVKAGDRRTFEAWLSEIIDNRGRQWFWQVHDVADVLRRWSSAVPAERLHVVTVPRPGGRPELLWERFASVLGIEPDGLDTAVRANSSLGVEGAELLRQVNESLPPDFPEWHRIELVREVLAHRILATRKNKTSITLPQGRADWVAEHSKQLVRHLEDRDYTVVGDLDELVSEPTSPSARDSQEDTDIWPETMAALIRRMASMREEARRAGRRDSAREEHRPPRHKRDILVEPYRQVGGAYRKHRDRPPVSRVKHMVVELGTQWQALDAALRGWRRVKNFRDRQRSRIRAR